MIKNPAKVVRFFGSKSAVARALNVAAPTAHAWMNNSSPLPVWRCLEIELLTDGAVKAEELNVNLDWKLLRKWVRSRQDKGAPPVAQ
jgi:DNA-binding transcriptional regulator YdaS (Cro superfamily)